jgi:hypothetical protein
MHGQLRACQPVQQAPWPLMPTYGLVTDAGCQSHYVLSCAPYWLLPCQVAVGGGEPAALRDALQTALPSAPPPNKQLVGERAMLHTTIARLLAPSLRPAPAGAQGQVRRVLRLGK